MMRNNLKKGKSRSLWCVIVLFISLLALASVRFCTAQTQEMPRLLWSYETKDEVESVSISSDGSYIGVGADKVYFFNQNGELLWSYKTDGGIIGISVSSDGSYLAAGVQRLVKGPSYYFHQGEVYFFSREGKLLWRRIIGDMGYGLDSVSISPDGSYVAAVNGKVYLFNREGELLWEKGWSRELASGESIPDSLFCVDLSRDSIVVGTELYIHLLNYEGVELKKLNGWNILPLEISVSSDGSFFSYVSAWGGGFSLFNREGEELWYRKTEETASSVSISSDGSYIVAGVGSYIHVFDQNGKLLLRYGIGNDIESVSVSSDGKYIAVGAGNKIYYFECKVPIMPTFILTEDPFNFRDEYTLDQSKLRPEEIEALPYVMKYAKEYKVSPCLVLAIIRQESEFYARADGDVDVGYMQVTYDAARYGGYEGSEREWLELDGLDPDQNIKYGIRYLKMLNDIFSEGKLLTGNLKATKVTDKLEHLKFVLAAYRGGPDLIANAQKICEGSGDNPERWDDVEKYLEDAGTTSEKAEVIRNYAKQVIKGRDIIDGQQRGYEFFLIIRVPVGGAPAPKKGVPGFEVIFAIACLLAVAYLARRKKKNF